MDSMRSCLLGFALLASGALPAAAGEAPATPAEETSGTGPASPAGNAAPNAQPAPNAPLTAGGQTPAAPRPAGAQTPEKTNLGAQIAALEVRLKDHPDDTAGLVRLAALYRMTERHADAAGIHLRLLDTAPAAKGSEHALLAARMLLKAGRGDEARALAAKHLGGPDAPVLNLALLSLFYNDAGLFKEQEEVLVEAARKVQDPRGKADYLLRAAGAARRRNDLAAARQHLTEALSRCPAGDRIASAAAAELKSLDGQAGAQPEPAK